MNERERIVSGRERQRVNVCVYVGEERHAGTCTGHGRPSVEGAQCETQWCGHKSHGNYNYQLL